MAVDQDGGQDGRLPVVDKAKMDARQFDLSEGQSGGGHNVVDARLGENLRNGLGVSVGHWLFRLDSVGGEKQKATAGPSTSLRFVQDDILFGNSG
jgi:hypothetical protein